MKNRFKSSIIKHLCIFTILIVSLSANVLMLSPYIIGHFSRDNTSYFDRSASDEEVLSAIVEASLSAYQSKMSTQEYRGLIPDIRSLFQPKRLSDRYNNAPIAYSLAGLSQYALLTKDTELLERLKQKADSWITPPHNTLSYELKVVDQCPIGIMYINLYRLTSDIKYKQVAEHIYNYLKDKRTDGNLIPYNNPTNNFSDAVGMYVPFLEEYFDLTGDSLAHQMAVDNIEHFKAHGCDYDTHIPFHGYNIETGIKLGSANWGRGIGWFLLAVAYCPETNDSTLQANIDKLPYTQFPLSSGSFDSSTALMFEIYKKAVTPDYQLSLDFIKPHIHTSGYVGDCSGDTYDSNVYSKTFGITEYGNGFLLLLYSTIFTNGYAKVISHK